MLKDVLMKRGLSHREAEVAELVTQGLSNKEIADKLFVTEKTIKFHLTNIYKKMSVKSRAQLIVWCLPHVGFVDSSKLDMQDTALTHQSRSTFGTAGLHPINSKLAFDAFALDSKNPGYSGQQRLLDLQSSTTGSGALSDHENSDEIRLPSTRIFGT